MGEALSHVKILFAILLVITFSLICPQVHADQPNAALISHKEDPTSKDKASQKSTDHSTITKPNISKSDVKPTQSKTIAKHIPKHQPRLSIAQPSNNTSLNMDTFQIHGNSSGDVMIPLVTWNVDNSPTWTASGTENWSFIVSSLSEGLHTIHVNAVDAKGNEQSKSIKVTIDMNPPTLAISSPITDDSLDHISSINGTASDDNAISSVRVIVDDQDVYKATYSKGIWSAPVKLYAGTHVVKSVAKDKAGNLSISRDVYFSLSNPKPPIMLQKIPYAQTSPIPTSASDNLENDTQDIQNMLITSNSNSNLGSSNSNSNTGSSNSNSHSGGSSNSNSHSGGSSNSNSHSSK